MAESMKRKDRLFAPLTETSPEKCLWIDLNDRKRNEKLIIFYIIHKNLLYLTISYICIIYNLKEKKFPFSKISYFHLIIPETLKLCTLFTILKKNW